MKKLLIFLFSLLIGIGLFVWVVRIVGWQEIKNAFLVFTGWGGLIILGLTVLMIIFAILRWREILKSHGYNISLFSLAGPYLSWFSLIYIAPMMLFGTEVFRSYLLKEKFSVPWNQGLSSTIIDRILDWTIYLIVFFVGIIFLFLEIGLPPKDIGLILGGIFILFIIGTSFFYFKVFKKESMVKIFTKHFKNGKCLNREPLEIEKEIFKFFKPREDFFWKAVGFSLLKTGIAITRAWFLIFFLGETLKLLPTIAIFGSHYLAALIPIPAAIGSHEIIQIFTFHSLGLEAGMATAFTMIIRGAEIIIVLVGIIILFQVGINCFKNNFCKKIKK